MQLVTLSIVFLFIHTLIAFYRRLTHKRNSVFCCGLFGFCGSEPPNMLKLKMLGYFNQSRGSHSCGIYYNGEAKHGVDKEAKWEDFVMMNQINPITGANVFIGHTRFATLGKHTLENAHPFVFPNIVGAHNGGIENYLELARRYGIDVSDCDVDSKAFIKIIGELWENEGTFSPVERYRGRAALLLTFPSEPDALWIYRGLSKSWMNEKNPDPERPLFTLQQKEGIYISSMFESLTTIRDNVSDTIYHVIDNCMVKIKNGVFMESDYVELNRPEDINVGLSTRIIYPTRTDWRDPKTETRQQPLQLAGPTQTTGITTTGTTNSRVVPIVYQEGIPNGAEVGKIFYHKGRYWHMTNEGIEIMNGSFLIDNKRNITDADSDRGSRYYFRDGIMLKSFDAYKQLDELRGRRGSEEFEALFGRNKNLARIYSRFSKFPITNLPDQATEVPTPDRFMWYIDGRVATSTFTPKFSSRNYHISHGVLKSISPFSERDVIFFGEGEEEPPKDFGAVIRVLEGLPVVAEEEKEVQYEDCSISCSIPIVVKAMVEQHCDRLYSSLSEIEAEMPSTVIRAIEMYLDDVALNYNLPIENMDKGNMILDFFATMMANRVSVRGAMIGDFRCLEEYVKAAYQEEMETVEEDAEDSIAKKLEDLAEAELIQMYENKEAEDAQSRTKLAVIINSIDSLRKEAEELTTFADSDLAQNSASEIYRSMDGLVQRLGDVFGKEGETSLIRDIQSINSNK